MTANLKPCYYCEGKKIVKREFSTSIEFTVECISCWARGPIVGSEAEAVEAWNHRPIEESLKARAVEVLADQLAKADFDVHYDSVDFRYPHGLRTAHMTEKERNQFIKEARALLGWEE